MLKHMQAKLSLSLFAGFAGFAVSAFAQINGSGLASDLRTKYGAPLARETFLIRPHFEMVVDYAPNGHVCRIQLPPVAPGRELGTQTIQAVDDFLLELLPLTMRGKELGRMIDAVGLPSRSVVLYENVTIAESFQGGDRTGITATFRNEECRK
jgi:hypothetical protein